MAKTVVGLFDDIHDAEAVVRELIDEGASKEHISLVRTGSDAFAHTFAGTSPGTTTSGAAVGGERSDLGSLLTNTKTVTLPGIGSTYVAGPLSSSLSRDSANDRHVLIDELTERGVADTDARFYAEGVRRGSTLVVLRVYDEDADDVADIMERHGATDLHSRTESWRARGWKDLDWKTTKPYAREEFDKERETWRATPRTGVAGTARSTERTGDVTLPVVEEDINIGKRQVQRAVRIHQEVRERPVEETVRLREERVRVERRPVNREVSGDRFDDLKDRTIEVRETSEEPVISKTARVKEEVVVHKDTNVREEKIRDSVKTSDVRVENIDKTRNPKR